MSFFAQWFTRDEVNFLDNHSDISKMINVRINYPIEIFSYLYIKSFRNNFKNMSSLVLAYDDILIVPEIKLDSSFLTALFVSRFSPYFSTWYKQTKW